MKVKIRDIGIDLIPETKEDEETTERFWKGGVHLLGYGTSGRMTLSFADLIEKYTSEIEKIKHIIWGQPPKAVPEKGTGESKTEPVVAEQKIRDRTEARA
jgi:hypothetical protein